MVNDTKAKQVKSSYGWIVVGASILLFFGAFGSQLCFGVFLKPLTDEFGWTRTAASGAMSVGMGISGLFGMVAGRLTDKYHVRIIISVGALVGGLAYFLLSSVSSLWQFYIYFGVGIGICVGSFYTPVNTVVSKWFIGKRTLALGIALLGITIGQMVLSPLIAQIIIVYDWKTAYIILSILVVIMAIPAVIISGKVPPSIVPTQERKDMKHANGNFIEPMQPPEWSAKESARTAPFWMLMITGFVISAGYYFVITHIVTYAIDNRISASAAALILTMMSIGGIGGSLLAWSIAAKLGTRYALLVLIAAQALAMFLFIWIRYLWLFYTTAILFGFSFAAAIPVRMSMIPQFFGMKSIGMIMGFATFAWSLGGIVGPVLAGYIFDISGSYSIAFLSGGLLLIIGVFAVQLLKFR